MAMNNPQKRRGRKRKSAVAVSGDTRLHILAAAEKLMREHGYAAVTTRRLGEEAGVTSPLIHFYFASMDDLFVSLYRHHAEVGLVQVREALATKDVLQALWKITSDPIDAVLHLEFMALGNHRKAMREVMAEFGEQFRRIQLQVLVDYLDKLGIVPVVAPEVLIVMLSGIGFLMALESESGMAFGHASTGEFVADLLHSIATTGKFPTA